MPHGSQVRRISWVHGVGRSASRRIAASSYRCRVADRPPGTTGRQPVGRDGNRDGRAVSAGDRPGVATADCGGGNRADTRCRPHATALRRQPQRHRRTDVAGGWPGPIKCHRGFPDARRARGHRRTARRVAGDRQGESPRILPLPGVAAVARCQRARACVEPALVQCPHRSGACHAERATDPERKSATRRDRQLSAHRDDATAEPGRASAPPGWSPARRAAGRPRWPAAR